MQVDHYDVAVVGAGPAGSTSAALLAARGYRVALLDKARFPRHKACGEYLSPGVIEELQQLGLQDLIRDVHPHPVAGMDIMSPGGKKLRIEYLLSDQRLYAGALSRHTLDAALVSHAVRCGAELTEGLVVKYPLVEDGVVCGVVGTCEGRQKTVRARLTVVADGTRSALARALALSGQVRWPLRMGLVAYYERSSGQDLQFGQMHVSRNGYCGVAPLSDDLLNVAIVVRMNSTRRAHQPTAEFYEQWISSRPALRATLEGARRVTSVRGVGPIGSRTGRSWMPGALLVGDAAGFFDPFTGEGIYRALRGAAILDAVASRALESGNVSGAQLRQYGALRAQAFGRKQVVTTLVQLFVQFPSLMEYAIPRLSGRPTPLAALSSTLGDIAEAGEFLNPQMLWSSFRP